VRGRGSYFDEKVQGHMNLKKKIIIMMCTDTSFLTNTAIFHKKKI